MGLINWIKKSNRKNEVDSVSEMIQKAAVAAFQQRIYEYPRSYFLRKGPREIRVNTRTHQDLPFPYTTCEVIGWIQRGDLIMDNPIKPNRAMFLCDQKKKECAGSRICGTLCKYTADVIHAKNGPVVNVREWEQRFNIENQNGLLVYVEKENESKNM